MTINWYPGHMKKTKELIKDNLKLIDVVVELLDARIPVSSKNPQIDESVSSAQSVAKRSIPINCITGEGVNRLVHEIKVTANPIIEKLKDKGMKERNIRVMIVGIPNVGKSSLINKLAGKKTAKIGNKPGVTKGKQWIRIRKGLEMFDTPGILWPKIDNQEVGMNLAFVGSIRDEILDIEEVALNLVDFLLKNYPGLIKERYKIEFENESALEVMDKMAIKRGCILKANAIDYHKISNILLDEYRVGKLGKISLEWPNVEK